MKKMGVKIDRMEEKVEKERKYKKTKYKIN
jgi:hypothetical protein